MQDPLSPPYAMMKEPFSRYIRFQAEFDSNVAVLSFSSLLSFSKMRLSAHQHASHVLAQESSKVQSNPLLKFHPLCAFQHFFLSEQREVAFVHAFVFNVAFHEFGASFQRAHQSLDACKSRDFYATFQPSLPLFSPFEVAAWQTFSSTILSIFFRSSSIRYRCPKAHAKGYFQAETLTFNCCRIDPGVEFAAIKAATILPQNFACTNYPTNRRYSMQIKVSPSDLKRLACCLTPSSFSKQAQYCRLQSFTAFFAGSAHALSALVFQYHQH